MAIPKKLILIASLLAIVMMSIVGFGLWWWLALDFLDPQPIAFNHKLHLDKIQGVVCVDCHHFVETQTYAGIPSKHVCFDCHDPLADEEDKEADVFQPKFADLMAYAATDGDIPWHRTFTTRDDVFFSHRRHVVVAEIDCEECHDMPTRTEPPTRGPDFISMRTCLNCHEEKEASEDCVACHR